MRVPAVKQKRIAAEDVLLLSLPPDQMLGLIGVVCLRPVLYPSDGELLGVCVLSSHLFWTSQSIIRINYVRLPILPVVS